MSADKDRGIRRQKQKRAKDRKRKAQQPAGVPGGAADEPAQRKAE